MISMTRASALRMVFVAMSCGALAMGCGAGPSQPSDSAAPQDDDTSEDELNTRARFTHLKSGPSDGDLRAVFAAGQKLENAYLGVYRFNKAGPEATDANARMNRVKEVMHRYMCSFFDESIDLARPTGANAVKQTMNDLDFDNNASDEDAKVAAFSDALKSALGNGKLDVMEGSASGNNTMGEVMGVYDRAHNEILYFGYTNCGSDD